MGVLTVLFSCERTSLELPDTLTDFKATLEVITPAVNDGDDFSICIHANRGFRLEGWECEWEAEDIEDDMSCDLSHDGTFTITCKEVSITEDHEGTVKLAVYDEHSDKTLKLSGTYTAYAHKIVYPSGITLSSDNLTVDYYDKSEPESGIVSFQVSMTPENSETGFLIEVVSGGIGKVSVSTEKDGTYAQSCKIDQNRGMIYVKGGDTGGQVFLKVSATANPKIFVYVEVYVRHRVALMLYGNFNTNLYVPCAHTSQMECGWFGIPSSIKCRLVSWNITDNDKETIEDFEASNIDGLQFSQFSKVYGTYSPTFRLTISPEKMESDNFYGLNLGDAERLVKNINHSANNISGTLPAMSQRSFYYYNLSNIAESSLDNVKKYVTEINDNNYWIGYWWFLNIQKYRHETEWTNVALTLENITYDKTKLDLRYCLYMFSARYSSGLYCGTDEYWWAAADHVPWIEKLNS